MRVAFLVLAMSGYGFAKAPVPIPPPPEEVDSATIAFFKRLGAKYDRMHVSIDGELRPEDVGVRPRPRLREPARHPLPAFFLPGGGKPVGDIPSPRIPFGLAIQLGVGDVPPPDIRGLRRLTALQINVFNGESPNLGWLLEGLTGLEHLSVWSPDFSVKDMEAIASTKSLKTLELHLSGTVKQWNLKGLSALKNLTGLTLNRSPDSAAWEEIHKMESISALRIHLPCIRDADLENAAKLANLRHLDIFSDARNAQPLAGIERLANLRSLNLANACLGDDGCAKLAAFEHLESLHLNDAMATDAGLKALGGLKTLRHLDFCSPKVTDAATVVLPELPNLETLDLSVTRVGPAGLENVARCKTLKRFALRGQSTTEESVKQFKSMKGLKELDLQNTAIGKPAYLELKSALPGCTILPPKLEWDSGS